MALQKIICGPILRRVETNKVSVWIAFMENYHITLKVWEGNAIKHDTTATPLATGQTHTLQFGQNLWAGVVTAEIPTPGLNADKVYSYNIVFELNDTPGENDFHSDGLLKSDKTLEDRPQLPIGYEADMLPTFVLPGSTPAKLNIVHGSCRKMHGYGDDALALVDAELEKSENRSDPSKRPQTMFLTGDQIYADEVPVMLLKYMCSLDGVGIFSAAASEKMKIKNGDNPEQEFETDITTYPPMFRQRLVNKFAGFTSSAALNHLLTFEEFCATYLCYWNIRSWNREFFHLLKDIPLDPSDTNYDSKLTTAVNTFVDSSDVSADTNLVNLIAHVQNTDAYVFDDSITKSDFVSKSGDKYTKWLDDTKDRVREELINIIAFMSKLPRVSRALANVPTYMMMDDHEVTDDWFITQRWNNQVLSKSFGRDIIRNAVMAYTVFQDWGNRPDDYAQAAQLVFSEIDSASNNKTKLLMYISEFCNRYATNQNITTVRAQVTDKIETMLGMSGTAPTLNWNYTVQLGTVQAIVLDTRTQRFYEGLNTVPELISESSLSAQTPQTLDGNPDFVFVISPCPVLGFHNFEELVQPAAAATVALFENDNNNPGIIGGRLEFDYEAWGFNANGFERLMDRLNGYKKVVLLSGDVHYGATLVMDYWKGSSDTPTSRIVQLTASAIKNEWMADVSILKSAMIQRILTNIGESVSKLGWKNKTVTKNGNVTARNRYRLYHAMAGIGTIPVEGWTAGATLSPQPDWRWRLKVLKDERPIENDEVKAEINLSDTTSLQNGYFQVVQRHQTLFAAKKSRRIAWNSNIGFIKFEADGSSWKLKHELKGASALLYEVPLTTPTADASKPVLP
ncbi:MAG: hypothetical protein QM640_10235 [Niabella sp.]